MEMKKQPSIDSLQILGEKLAPLLLKTIGVQHFGGAFLFLCQAQILNPAMLQYGHHGQSGVHKREAHDLAANATVHDS